MQRLMFLCFLLLFATISCRKVEIENYKTEIIGEWVPAKYEITFPPTTHISVTYQEDGKKIKRMGDCKSDSIMDQSFYKMKNDTIILIYANGQDTGIIRFTKRNCMEVAYLYHGNFIGDFNEYKRCK